MTSGAVATLPTVLAVVGYADHGPSDGRGSASCPHCGAAGRYVYTLLCADGTRRGAMSGCLRLFPQAPEANLVGEALKRATAAAKRGERLSTWWADMVAAVRLLEAHVSPEAIEAFKLSIRAAEGRRQAWLRSNGYGRRGRR